MHELVLARYAEQLDWIVDVPEEFAVHIYNKGAPVTAPAVLARATRIAQRPNEGRESETYLHHIASLAATGGDDDIIVFAQGDPFEHSPDFIALLRAHAQWHALQPLSWRWKARRDIPPAAILQRETAAFIEGLRIRPEVFSLLSWSPLGFADVGTDWLQATYRGIHGLPDGTSIAAHFLAACGLDALAAAAQTHLLGRFSYGAVFAARRHLLRGLPPPAIARLRQAALAHEVYGYVLERLWLHLFGAGFLLPVALAPGQEPLASPQMAFVDPDRSTPAQKRVRRIARRVRGLVARG